MHKEAWIHSKKFQPKKVSKTEQQQVQRLLKAGVEVQKPQAEPVEEPIASWGGKPNVKTVKKKKVVQADPFIEPALPKRQVWLLAASPFPFSLPLLWSAHSLLSSSPD